MTKLKGIINQEPQLQSQLTKEPNILVTMTNGARGSSAYEIWLKQGNIGTAEEFLESLKASAVDYNSLENKPTIGNIVLEGDRSFEDLGMASIDDLEIKNLF